MNPYREPARPAMKFEEWKGDFGCWSCERRAHREALGRRRRWRLLALALFVANVVWGLAVYASVKLDARMADTLAELAVARATPPGHASTPPATPSAVPAAHTVPIVVPPGSGVFKFAEGSYIVERRFLEEILERESETMRCSRIGPLRVDGKVKGIELYGIRPDSLFTLFGLQNGDVIEKVNGYDTSSPDQSLAAYANIRALEYARVELRRGGKLVVLEYRIV